MNDDKRQPFSEQDGEERHRVKVYTHGKDIMNDEEWKRHERAAFWAQVEDTVFLIVSGVTLACLGIMLFLVIKDAFL